MTDKQTAEDRIIEALTAYSWRSSYQIGEMTNLSTADLHPALFRLEDAGRITSRWEDMNPPRRRRYALVQNSLPATSKTSVAATPYENPPPMGVQVFWCSWWSRNQLHVRPPDGTDVPEGLWLHASSESTEWDEGEGVNVLLNVEEIRALHTLLGNWLTSRSWPSEPKMHGKQAEDRGDA